MRRQLRFLWAAAVDLWIDGAVGTIFLVGIVGLLGLGALTLPALGFGVLLILAAAQAARLTGFIERHRAAALLEVTITPQPRRLTRVTSGWAPVAQAFVDLAAPSTWKTLLHHLFSALAGGLLAWLLGRAVQLVADLAGVGVLGLRGPLPAIGAALLAIVVLAGYVYGAGSLDRVVSRALLGTSRTAVLERRVDQLADARQGAVASAEVDRSRIERDLHDGVQPGLVSVAMTIDLARTRLGADPDAARELLDTAHAQAKQNITELRRLVRGIHPAVLTDRGLDAALSAVAGQSPVPTAVSVRLPGRLPAEAEAVVYFSVAEALTNVAKHAQASSASVEVEPIDGGVRAVIRDDGRGGAAIGSGAGLTGMRERVRAAGGTLHIDSSVGGPTIITVEVPCAS
ncbi:sensor histidine kinase [Arenivirga flava]|uniref:histidine kinase n=1 Tax=Arenivirga flava TaxID=1930060 RepID=A0AA37UET6_9MICO|nr:histidine kinase [Arenivirga flava]GMA28240.1 sensor histidine kinase [Arenivirga flava]